MGDGRRGRLISASDRRQAVELISEAVDSGAALYKACAELGISKRTYNRWRNNTNDYIDERTTCVRLVIQYLYPISEMLNQLIWDINSGYVTLIINYLKIEMENLNEYIGVGGRWVYRYKSNN